MSHTPNGTTTQALEACIRRLQQGDPEAKTQLLDLACSRLQHRARQLLSKFVHNVPRGTETDDVVNELVLRLWKSLEKVQPNNVREFFALSAMHINWILKDWVRKPQAIHHLIDQDPTQSSSMNPQQLAMWTELHEQIENLPAEEREVFDLLYYHETSQEEAAQFLEVSLSTVKRRWSKARRRLHDLGFRNDVS